LSDIDEIWKTLNEHFSINVPSPYLYEKCFTYYLKVYKQEMIDKKKYG
jgi:hypothetical protein